MVLSDVDSGRLVAAAMSPHPATSPPVGEQDPPPAWWSALSGCFERPAERAARIRAISVGAQRWALGTGDSFEPELPTGHGAIRARYRDARDRLLPASPSLPAAPNP
ncbi:MAG: hypothetical protein F4131_00875 [Acidimicrobiaceae bacterium]|nr:hypothetical protein [Acidimicrobiaceae bacterium]